MDTSTLSLLEVAPVAITVVVVVLHVRSERRLAAAEDEPRAPHP
jgi:hypothetical protein